MTTPKTPYEPWPMDLAVLPLLPPEGAMLGGIHHEGRRVKDLAAQLGEHATSAQVQSRLRLMKVHGYVVDKPATGGRVWQRTEAGARLLQEAQA